MGWREGSGIRVGLVVLLGLAVCGITRASAEPLARKDVPAPLAPWVNWVLRGAEETRCPFVHAAEDRRQCAWPSRLSLELTRAGGRFRQEWSVHVPTWVRLPGGGDSWPENVRLSRGNAVVIARGGVPSLKLDPGRYTVTGRFVWPELPDHLRVPGETGLIALELRGAKVPFPERDAEGRVWLQRVAEAGGGESRLDVTVHRRVVDDVPLLLDTNIKLEVSGESREVQLGPVLPERFLPLALESALPARVEPDGRLRVQVRPGTWRLSLRARFASEPDADTAGAPPDAIELGAADDPWDEEEVWVFASRSDLRLVHVEGVRGVDPQQTTLPDVWRPLPAYLMKPGSRMRLVEKRRGDADPAPDRLALERTWWLDFDGGGYTVHDEIEGALSESWRLETLPPLSLGRVAIQGRDQFISWLNGDGRSGVEVRQGQVELDADSRLDGVRSSMRAVGWNHDFQKVSGTLHLPPGWRLLHAFGVDDVRTTWTTHWSLLDIFLVLITSLVVAQLFGRGWGVVALLALTLIYPEPGAPRWSWLGVLAAAALLRVTPAAGRLHASARLARLVAIAVLALAAVPFVVQQARLALYPALEFPDGAVDAGWMPAMAPPEVLDEARVEHALEELAAKSVARERVARSAGKFAPFRYAPDPQALVSTGPGLPDWSWRSVRLAWRGPVEREQEIRLLLVPPWGNFLLAWLRIAGTVVLVLCVLDVARWRPPSSRTPRAPATTVAALGLALLIGATEARADIPSPELLQELRARLIEPPECYPACASSPRLALRVTPRTLTVRVALQTAAHTAVPLPGGLAEWLPETVLVDGAPAKGLGVSPDGRLFVELQPGRHQVTLRGPLPPRDSVQLPLPLRPQRVEARVSGWTLAGVRPDGVPAESLLLTREAAGDGVTSIEPSELPPFVRIERTLELGLSWQVSTRVTRTSPRGSALFLEVPLLPGESVTSESVRVEDGHALVNLAAAASGVAWTSILEPASRLELIAPTHVPWTEVWHLDVAPVWNVAVAGIPVVHQPGPPEIRTRTWRPWPGERVELEVVRPAGVDGRTLTLDRSQLSVEPGLRASEAVLTLSLRASRGVQHPVVLPDAAILQSVKIDDRLQPVREIDGRVVLPIQPGAHTAEVRWRSPTGISTRYVTPAPDLGARSVNAELELNVPADRWVLWVGGPRLGPAVLFWSLLVVAALAAIGLGLVPLTPLGWGSWLLLFVGLTQVPVWLALVVVGWLLALGWRRDHGADATDAAFDALQLLLAAWTVAALLGLVFAIRQGLLGAPDMQVAGNGSSGRVLRWYQDRSDPTLPTAWMLSVPLGLYRIAMLAWALWLAAALVRWLRWGWACFSEGDLWRPLRRPSVQRTPGP